MHSVVVALKKTSRMTGSFLTTSVGAFLLGAGLGILFFILFYGTKVIDPSYTDWLLGGDLRQHFLGWEFYRDSPWSVPLGMIPQLAYPFGISITYMDSIPIIAIPLKIFESMLPNHFQYFGVWGLLCYALQGGIAALIIRRWSKNVLVVLCGSIIFIASPMVIARMFAHTALAGQWIVLLAILAFLELRRYAKPWLFITIWSGIFVLAAGTHPYFLPMVALPFVMAIIMSHKQWTVSVIKTAVPPAIGAAFFWLIGGLAVKGSANGLGEYAFNLSSLYNPLNYSAFLETQPIASTSGETMNYFGLGMALLTVVAIVIFIYNHRSFKRIKRVLVRFKNPRYILIALSVLALLVVATSPRVQWGVKIIVDLNVPEKIERLWGTFRAGGRLFWPVYYLLAAGVLWYVIRSLRHHSLVLVSILAIATTMQVADIVGSPAAIEKHVKFMQIDQGEIYATSRVEQREPFAATKQHMVYLDTIFPEDFYALADIALKYDLTMNTGYFARSPEQQIIAYQADQKAMVLKGTADFDTNLYVTKDPTIAQEMQVAGREVTIVSGYYVVN